MDKNSKGGQKLTRGRGRNGTVISNAYPNPYLSTYLNPYL